jgi:serine/threonine protein kinase
MGAEVFGPYRLVSRLGAGGMGEVWRALDTRKDREVAVKVMGAWLGAEPGYAARFRREAASAARLNAPNIIPVHDYGEIDGRLFMEMPLIAGADLGTLITQHGRLDPPRVVGLIEQVVDALDTAHHAGLVHRDVKPSNVLVSPRPGGHEFAYLIDFGIARAAGDTHLTTTGRTPGTLAYMAPELFESGGDARADVYALACVLYQALTGQAPFVPPDHAHPLGFYLNAHLHRPPPQPSAGDPPLPTAWDAVIARGMAKDPEQRYPSAGELATAAHAALTAARPVRESGQKNPADVPPLATDTADRAAPRPPDSWTGGRWWSLAAATARSGFGTWPPVHLSANPLLATPVTWKLWRRRSSMAVL